MELENFLIDDKLNLKRIIYYTKLPNGEIEYNGVLYADNGGTMLAQSISKNLNDYYNLEREAVKLFQDGKIHCADCGKLMNYEENRSHRYFAGLYCDECWNGKWKAIEAEETYN